MMTMTLKLVDRGGYWHVAGKFMGKEVRKSTGKKISERGEAELFLASEIARAVAAKDNDSTLAKVLEEYRAKLYSGGKLTSQSGYMIDEWISLAGKLNVSQVNAGRIEELVMTGMSGLKANSIRRKLNVLSAAINYGAARGMCQTVKLMLPKVDDARDTHLTIEEVREFIEWLDVNKPEYKLAFMVLMDTGVRLGEMRKLRWRDITEDMVVVRSKVNGKTRLRSVPLSGRLKAEIAKHRGAPSALCFGDGKTEWKAASVLLGRTLKAWAKEAGVEDLRVHDLRHTFAYQCAFHGCDLGELQMLMGHANVAMTMRYRGFIMSKAKGVIDGFG